MKWHNFTFLVRKGIHAVWYNRLMSFASFCVLLVSLLLVGLAVLTGANINVVLGYTEDRNEVAVYVLEDHNSAELIKQLTRDYTSSVVFYSKETAWEEWKASTPEAALIYSRMTYNPMPDTYRVTFNDITKIQQAALEYLEIEGVEGVGAPDDFVEMLIDMRNALTLIGTAIIIALSAISLIIVYNSSRASVFSRRQEINIMKYVGATNAFVKIPFFIEGLFIGLLAGAASWGLTAVAYNAVMPVMRLQLLQILGGGDLIAFSDVTVFVLVGNAVAGAVLSASGIVMSLGKHLKV